MKKVITAVLISVMMTAMLAGCGTASNTSNSDSSIESTSTEEQTAISESSEASGNINEDVSSAEYGLGDWHDLVYSYDKGEMNYSVYLPSGYDEGGALPLITYIPDATYAGRSLSELKRAECPSAWITEENMREYPAIFLIIEIMNGSSDISDSSSDSSRVVPIIDEVIASYAVNENRLYLTGQSMGGIFDFAINDAYPDKFAATVYVGCQPGGEPYDDQFNQIVADKQYLDQTFVYITSAKDAKAPKGQEAIMNVLDEENVEYGLLQNIDHEGGDVTDSGVKKVLDQGCKQNFFQFTQVADGSPAQEHMKSFQYAYNINAIYEWMVSQSK